jgi:hypothetical protein
MSTIPLPSLDIKIPQFDNPLDQYSKALQIKGMMQQHEMQSVQLQQAQQQQRDQQILGQLMIKNQGNLDKVIQAAPQAGVMPNTVLQLQAHAMDVKQKQQTLTADQLKNFSASHDNAAGLVQSVLDARTPADKDAAYQSGLQAVQTNPQMYGITDPSQIPPAQRPPDDALRVQLSLHMGQKEQAAQTMKEREVAAQEMAAQARQTMADNQTQKAMPLPPAKLQTANDGFNARWQINHPGQPAPKWAQLQPGATLNDFSDVDKQLEQTEKAYTAQQNLRAAQANRSSDKNTNRADRSYQFNSEQLEKIAQPVDQLASRIGRLQDSLAQNSPQADALVAPELLSVMAGGAGSGLRMNEAEISRVIGGRSNWEGLKAAANQWSTDPNSANSITPNQRQQIRALMSEVQKKVSAKQQALQSARDGLLNSDDPGEHRMIVVKARQAITDVDTGANQPTTGGFDPKKDFHPIPQ